MRRRSVVAIAAATVIGVGALFAALCARCSIADELRVMGDGAPDAASPHRYPEHNAVLSVPPALRAAGEPGPVVVAWEDSGDESPTFLLYEGGLWIRRSPDREVHYETGRLAPDEAQSLHQGFSDAGLVAMPPFVRLREYALDTNIVVLCVGEGDRWTCGAVDGVEPATPTALDGGVRFVARSREEGLPVPFARALRALDSFTPSSQERWEPERFEVAIALVDLDATSRERGDVVRPWPSEVAPPDLRGLRAGETRHLPLLTAEASVLRSSDADWFRVGERTVSVWRIAPRLPAADYLRSLRARFDRLVAPR